MCRIRTVQYIEYRMGWKKNWDREIRFIKVPLLLQANFTQRLSFGRTYSLHLATEVKYLQ